MANWVVLPGHWVALPVQLSRDTNRKARSMPASISTRKLRTSHCPCTVCASAPPMAGARRREPGSVS